MQQSGRCPCNCGTDQRITLIPDDLVPACWLLCPCTRCAGGWPCQVRVSPVKLSAKGYGYCGECEEYCQNHPKKARGGETVVSEPNPKKARGPNSKSKEIITTASSSFNTIDEKPVFEKPSIEAAGLSAAIHAARSGLEPLDAEPHG